MAKVHTEKPKRKHHRLRKLVKLALIAGAAYGAKKYLERKKKSATR